MIKIKIAPGRVIYGTLESYRYTGPSVVFPIRIYLDSTKEGRYVQIIHDFTFKLRRISGGPVCFK
jgi:hypothetical protein